MKLSILVCDRHGFYAVEIGDDSGGTRITPSKCCGSWRRIKSWSLSQGDWEGIANKAKACARKAATRD